MFVCLCVFSSIELKWKNEPSTKKRSQVKRSKEKKHQALLYTFVHFIYPFVFGALSLYVVKREDKKKQQQQSTWMEVTC